ncbi:hypothetical protein BDZ89DRAFT_550512 [Hymenopellis radicata]|nr:hypothetical protein BDZ89DRAFT_550512 [Hymenopellis radicata]
MKSMHSLPAKTWKPSNGLTRARSPMTSFIYDSTTKFSDSLPAAKRKYQSELRRRQTPKGTRALPTEPPRAPPMREATLRPIPGVENLLLLRSGLYAAPGPRISSFTRLQVSVALRSKFLISSFSVSRLWTPTRRLQL